MHQYAAGLIDGEGYIGIQETGGSFQVRLKVAMSDKGRSALEQMVRLYGGRINDSKARNERNRDTCTWVVTGEHACSVIREVKKWLIVKQEPASIALSFQVMLEMAERRPNGRRAWTDEMRAKASELRARIQEANRRGPDPEVNPRISNMTPIAKYRAGAWWDANDSLFGPEPFSSGLPTSGAMIDGVIYEARPEIPSSLPRDETLLRTPCAAEVEGGALSPARAKAENRTLRLSGQMIDLVNPKQLLPTPDAYAGSRGGSQEPEKRRAGGHTVSLSDVAEHKLLPTPTVGDKAGTEARSGKGFGPPLGEVARKLLPTPRASDPANTSSHASPGFRPPLGQVVRELLPTPRATDETKGGPNQRGSKGDLMLPSAVHRLTGDPTSQQSDEPKPPWEDVPLPLQS